MTPDQSRRLQAALGVVADGIIGANTLRALFARFGANPSLAGPLGRAGARDMLEAGILETPLRLAHFVAQAAHETGGFRLMRELWGPTPAQRGYEGRRDLGNTQAGDGFRYRGRGIFQLTGRANYRDIGDALGLPLEAQPELAEQPGPAMATACRFWTTRRLNALADADDVRGVTRRINGGFNGLAERIALLAKAKGLMA